MRREMGELKCAKAQAPLRTASQYTECVAVRLTDRFRPRTIDGPTHGIDACCSGPTPVPMPNSPRTEQGILSRRHGSQGLRGEPPVHLQRRKRSLLSPPGMALDVRGQTLPIMQEARHVPMSEAPSWAGASRGGVARAGDLNKPLSISGGRGAEHRSSGVSQSIQSIKERSHQQFVSHVPQASRNGKEGRPFLLPKGRGSAENP